MKLLATSMLTLSLAACATTPTPPSTKVQVVRETVEVPVPCKVTVPARPGAVGNIPENSEQALAKVGAKLIEYAGSGKWADRMEAAMEICQRAAPAQLP